jgi:Ca2+-transporting ATPase
MNESRTPWSLPSGEILEQERTVPDGLSEAEAERRLKETGRNEIDGSRRLARFHIIVEQVSNPLILILCVAALISLVLAEWVDAGIIFATVIANAALGYWQENKAETVLEQLKAYLKIRTRVRRGGHERELDTAELVPGDIVRLVQGDRVPADGRILAANALQTDESVLTGESLPVEKHAESVRPDAPLGERASMVWSGTLVVQGYADMVVIATGKNTEFGRIAGLATAQTRDRTPLQHAIGEFAKLASVLVIVLAVLLFVVGLALGRDPVEMFFIAVAISVSAVPEGLPITLTVILAIGVQRLAKKNGIVRKLLAAETLGSTSIILTDKTGTLTQADMRLVDVVPYGATGHEAEETLLREAVLNADVVIENPEALPKEWRLVGKSMESALVRDAAARGVRLPEVLGSHERLDRIPFDSKRKYGVVLLSNGGPRALVVMGAPEIVLAQCDLADDDRRTLMEEIERRALGGERLLGVASLDADGDTLKNKVIARLHFRGFLAFRDPVRPHIKEAIARIARAGVRTVIVTGDHKGTAEHVAREIGLFKGKTLVLTGPELERMSRDELKKKLKGVGIFARVTPEQKLMLADLYQERGEVVAVTGDGVNDAPALRTADVGIAVGSGTEVAKSAADLVILDDNFLTIVAAIEEGRRILGNIRKALSYLLSNAFAELVLIGGSILFGLHLPISAIQILFVNFFSDSFPAIALAFEELRDTTKRSSARGTHVILTNEVRFLVFGLGLLASILLFVLYHMLLALEYDPVIVRAFIFAAFSENKIVR